MRNAVLLIALFYLVACGSAQKKSMMEGQKGQAHQKKMMKSGQKMMKGAKGSQSSCVMGKDTRIIRVEKTASGGCELFYTKFGEEKPVASSGFGTQYCEEVRERIQTNLDQAGFSCQVSSQ